MSDQGGGSEIERLRRRRSELSQHLALLPTHSPRRTLQRGTLAEVTRRILELELSPAAEAIPSPADEGQELKYFQK